MTAALLPANPFRWSLRWATDVRTAADGTEQREALAVYPREAFSGSFYLPDASYATIRQMLSAGPAGATGVDVAGAGSTVDGGAPALRDAGAEGDGAGVAASGWRCASNCCPKRRSPSRGT